MKRFLKMGRGAVVLMLAASVPLVCQMAVAEPEGGQDAQDAIVISVEQDEVSSAADANTQSTDATVAESGVAPEQAVRDDTANAGQDASRPEQKRTQLAAGIPSTNPDDANKHPAWRKREANKAIGELRKLKNQMMQQGEQ